MRNLHYFCAKLISSSFLAPHLPSIVYITNYYNGMGLDFCCCSFLINKQTQWRTHTHIKKKEKRKRKKQQQNHVTGFFWRLSCLLLGESIYKLQNLHLCFAAFTIGYKSLSHRSVHLPARVQQGSLWPEGL